ncbi:CgeB family protein [Thermodesulfovibrio hydrogeniphilus]
MRVLLLSSFSKPWDNFYSYKLGFEKNGHKVYSFGKRDSELLNFVNSNKPDFILFTKDEVDVEFLEPIKGKVPLVMWYPDPVIPDWLIPYVKVTDVLFTMSEGLIEEFKKYNPKTFWLTQAFEPDLFRISKITDDDIKNFSCDVTHIGNLGSKAQYLIRRQYLKRIIREGFKLKWWGPPLPRKISTIPLLLSNLNRAYGGRMLWGEDYAKACILSKIYLGVDSMPHIKKSMSDRLYKSMGCGAFYLCRYVNGIEEMFKIGEELETFNDKEEMIDKIRFYIKNETLRKKIAEKGKEKILKEHTYEIRIKQMMEILKKEIL